MAEHRTESHDIASSSGATLAAKLEVPSGPVRGWALFAHCFTCSKDLKAVVRISRSLADRGIGVLRFDFTGIGESEGDFADTTFTSNLDDLESAAAYLAELKGGPDLLVGHSLGGAAVLAAAVRIPQARAVATIGAPSDTGHLRETLVERAPELAEDGSATVDLGGRPVRVGRELLEDLAETRMEESIGELERPLLVFHSPVDSVVGIDHAAKIYELARHPKSFISLDRADHLLSSDPEDSRFVAAVLSAWASRYLGEDAREAADEALDDVVDGVVSARWIGPRYTTELRAGRHRWMGDEPVSVGGDDRGPSPYELLLGALGACKAMTVKMYADRKEWPLDAIEVDLAHDRIHAEDCDECETESGKLDRIEVEVRVEGELDTAQRRRLLEISEKCPVHRTLRSETVIRSRPDGKERPE